MRFEILIDSTGSNTPINPKGEALLRAFAACAPNGSKIVTHSDGTADALMIYGAGAAHRQRAMQRYQQAGKPVVVWDLGYWGKDRGSMRLAINRLHPSAQQLSATSSTARAPLPELREDADPTGPVLLIGMGPKSSPLYGLQPLAWERAKMRELRARFPGRQIHWRPKGRVAMQLLDAPLRHGGTIAEALRGCSLVVCRHSNVAVDACIAGVPVECEDGAARFLYAHNPNPSREQRADFLARLTHWNYTPNEVVEGWQCIERVLVCAS